MTTQSRDRAGSVEEVPSGSAGGVCVVGSINVDEIVVVPRHPLPGETLLATSSTVAPGGKGANQAVAAARLGARVGMIGAVGDDGRARTALSLLAGAGVDLTDVVPVDGPTGIARITVDDVGENTIIVVPGANARVDDALVAARSASIARAAVVVLQGEIPVDASACAARLATGRVLLNLAPVIGVPGDLLQAADPLVVNEHEARLLLADVAGRTDPDADDGRIAVLLQEQGARSVVLTLGARGALCVDDDGVTTIASPRVDAVDTSGAGDAFVGALAMRLADGDELRTAVRFAVRVGAFAVGSAGTQPSYPWAGDELPSAAAENLPLRTEVL
ncbi:ribokinase [Microbacterium soli]|uniref:Ribokinase n=2 Tax=Microbacterium soli TaxID=446075 RepID=A0ABP7MS19_9MICO